jgi:hypothetical protein
MTQFMNHTLDDLRGGRESWRVLLVFCSVAFTVAFVVGLNVNWV